MLKRTKNRLDILVIVLSSNSDLQEGVVIVNALCRATHPIATETMIADGDEYIVAVFIKSSISHDGVNW